MFKKEGTTPDKLWGGAHKSTDQAAMRFAAASDVTSKIIPENILIPYDIKTNHAHIKMLHKVDILTSEELTILQDALDVLLSEYKLGDFAFDPSFEDIHSQIETVITDRIGESGKKIHTGRSRNDQVTTDLYLYLHDIIAIFSTEVDKLIQIIESVAKKHHHTVCPGYTHHQKAVVTSFGDILHAYATMFTRDLVRLKQIKDLYNYSPLGATTGYESLLPLDIKFSSKELGFASPYASSIDVISTRGEFETAYANGISQFMTHVSMMAQTLITFSSQAYGFVTIADEHTTGSSVMPHKKNPDLLEIMKAKNVYIHSLASGLSSLLQAAFIGYNRDSQYSKMLIMQLVEESKDVPVFLSKIIDSMQIHADVMLTAASSDFVTSTGLMELLVVKKKLAMRDAKKLIEKAVAYSESGHIIEQIALDKAASELDINISVDAAELDKWQMPQFQLQTRRNRFGV